MAVEKIEIHDRSVSSRKDGVKEWEISSEDKKHLIKFLSWEKLNDEKKMKTSLGGNLRSLNGILSEDLRSLLIRYDDLAYVPAKHDFNVPKRRHRFTSREVVHTLFITLQLGQEIIRLSEKARAYSEEKTNDLWGSSNKQT